MQILLKQNLISTFKDIDLKEFIQFVKFLESQKNLVAEYL